MFIIPDSDAATLSPEAKELLRSADDYLQSQCGALLPRTKTRLYKTLTGTAMDESEGEEFFDYFLELRVLFPQLPNEFIVAMAHGTHNAGLVPMMRMWGPSDERWRSELCSIENSAAAVLDSTSKFEHLSSPQAEILRTIARSIEGDGQPIVKS